MSVQFRIVGVTRDRRTKAQLQSARAIEQERLDQALERKWRERVRANVQARADRKVEAFLAAPSDINTESRI
jgi:hypothetical protein